MCFFIMLQKSHGAGRGISQPASPTNKIIGNNLKVRVKGKVVAVDKVTWGSVGIAPCMFKT